VPNKKLLAIVWNIMILFFCLINLSDINEVKRINIPNVDKIVHFVFYTVSSYLWLLAVLKGKVSKKTTVTLVALGLILFGLTVEYLQDTFTVQRSFEWLDVLSNTLGVLFGTTVYLLYEKWKPRSL